MVESLKILYKLLPAADRMKFGALFLLMVLASFFEVLGISMIPAFVITIAEPERVLGLQYIGPFLENIGVTTAESLAFAGAILLIFVYVLKNGYLTYFKYLRQKFLIHRKIYLQNRIFKAYMTSPYTFYLSKNSAELLRNVRSEVNTLISGTICPLWRSA